MKHTLLTLMASAILCAATLATAETLQEMQVIDHGITAAVVRNPDIAILIVESVIPELSFESSMGIIEVKHDRPGEWILYLFPGTNLITFKAEGYKAVSKMRLVIPEKRARQVEVKLLKKYGVLTVESNPSGSRIFLDGKDTGKQTPYSFENLGAGLHLVVLKMNDYQTDTTRVDVKHEDMLRINPTLQAVGYLTLDTVPSEAEVVIDSGTEEAITVRTPVEKLELKTGPHALSVHKVGYALIEKYLVTIEKGKTIRKDLDLGVQLAEIKKKIARKQAKLRSLESEDGWWGMNMDLDIDFNLYKRTKGAHIRTPGLVSGLILCGVLSFEGLSDATTSY